MYGTSSSSREERMSIAPGVTASRVGGGGSPGVLDPLRSNRRPGQVPPFAVFSQEKRGRLQELHPEYNFGELGRRLSEMWHALSEEDKELYRRKARLIGVQKLKAWDDKMKRNAPYFIQQKAAAPPSVASRSATPPSNASTGSTTIKRRRTHGYAIFMSEERKKHSTLNVPLGDVTRKVAEAWRSLDPSVRATYEAKANRINAIENRRYQQALIHQQRSVAAKQQQQVSPQPLRIASVESLSRPKPNVNLPSGITISRVEPEGKTQSSSHAPSPVVSANRKNSLIDMRINSAEPGGLIDMRGRQPPMPKMAPRVPSSGVHYPPPLQRRPNIHHNGILPMSYALPGSAGMPMKRGGLPPSAGAPLSKRPKQHILPPRPPLMRQGKPPPPTQSNNTASMPSPIGILGTLDTWEKMCRLCGRTLIPIIPIGEDPLILEKIREYLGLDIDPEADKEGGYPPGLCRKCSGMLNGFDRFKKVVSQGQGHLDELAKVKRGFSGVKRRTRTSILPYEDGGGSFSSESILPDLDIEIEDNVPRPMLPRPKNNVASSGESKQEDEEGSLSSRSSMMGSNGRSPVVDEEDDIDPDFDPLNFLQVSDVVGDYDEESNGGGTKDTSVGEEEDNSNDNSREDEEDRSSEKSTDDIQIANAIYESLMDQSGTPQEEGEESRSPKDDHDNDKEAEESSVVPQVDEEVVEEPVDNGDKSPNEKQSNPSKDAEEDLNNGSDEITTNGGGEEKALQDDEEMSKDEVDAMLNDSKSNDEGGDQSLIDKEEKYIECEMEEVPSAAEDGPFELEEEEDPFPEPPIHVQEEEDPVTTEPSSPTIDEEEQHI